MERLRYLHGDREQLNRVVRSEWVSDRQIEAQIRRAHEEYGLAICPHTATAFEAWERLEETERRKPWVLVSTAHAAKFEAVVEPLIGTKVEVPPALAAILERPSRSTTIAATLEALEQALDNGFGGD